MERVFNWITKGYVAVASIAMMLAALALLVSAILRTALAIPGGDICRARRAGSSWLSPISTRTCSVRIAGALRFASASKAARRAVSGSAPTSIWPSIQDWSSPAMRAIEPISAFASARVCASGGAGVVGRVGHLCLHANVGTGIGGGRHQGNLVRGPVQRDSPGPPVCPTRLGMVWLWPSFHCRRRDAGRPFEKRRWWTPSAQASSAWTRLAPFTSCRRKNFLIG